MMYQAEAIFRSALQAVDVSAATEREIRLDGTTLQIGSLCLEASKVDRILILAAGKAASAMYTAAVGKIEALMEAMPYLQPPRVHGMIVAPQSPRPLPTSAMFFAGAHPSPNEISRAAAEAALELLRRADAKTVVVFLLSGGASSMLEAPLLPSVSNAQMASLHRALVESGLPIREMNVVRKHVSSVKGGRLANAAKNALAQTSLIVSDVPEAELDSVASGPSMPDRSTWEEATAILSKLGNSSSPWHSVLERMLGAVLPETPKPGDSIFNRCFWSSILSSHDLATAAAAAASALGFSVHIDNTCDEWDYRRAGDHLLNRAVALPAGTGHVCLISTGEVQVQIDGPSGLGGRNQHFALWCAGELERRSACLTVLSAGSDGIDGNSPAAGAIIDKTTWAEARAAGSNPERALATFDSFPLLKTLNLTIETGPTGTNLRDLRLFLR